MYTVSQHVYTRNPQKCSPPQPSPVTSPYLPNPHPRKTWLKCHFICKVSPNFLGRNFNLATVFRQHSFTKSCRFYLQIFLEFIFSLVYLIPAQFQDFFFSPLEVMPLKSTLHTPTSERALTDQEKCGEEGGGRSSGAGSSVPKAVRELGGQELGAGAGTGSSGSFVQ